MGGVRNTRFWAHTFSFEILIAVSPLLPAFWLDFLGKYFEVQMENLKPFLRKIKLAKKLISI